MSANYRLQNLRECSVRIFRAAPDDPVGTGIAVRDNNGEIVILTCAHVAETALGNIDPRNAGDQDVGIYFPQARGPETKERRARVHQVIKDYNDDIVMLRLIGDPAPLAPEQIAVLGRAEPSQGNPFRSYGYPQTGAQQSFWVDGDIQGPVEPDPGLKLQTNPVQLCATNNVGFLPGMSGSAVLDKTRNLIVGLVSDRYKQGDSTTAIGWGQDAQILTFDPFRLQLREDDFPGMEYPQPKTDIAQAQAATAPKPGNRMEGAPEPLKEWVGRTDMLVALNQDWADLSKRVTGLIGFGGEGKSSLARQWLANLTADKTQPQPEGVFWWPFYDRRNTDEFFEAAIVYLGGGMIDPRRIPSASAKAQIIGAMLGARRYLFVLDGLEVIQHQDGDQYGLLTSPDMRDLLAFFAAPGHNSFCLITSRAPMIDLLDYPGYTHRDVDRLSSVDGRDLLRTIGVKGPDHDLDRTVEAWDGHALTLGLIASLLVEKHGGDIAHLKDLPAPTADEPRYERVHRVLRRYDEHLNEAERAFLTLFSAFRTPVQESAFEKVFRTKTSDEAINLPLTTLDDAAFTAMVQRLGKYGLLRYNADEKHYTTHPLIRNHYFTLLSAGHGAQATHESLKDYYLSVAGDLPHWPTMDDLLPLIEVVHHACRAGAYDEAKQIQWERIDQRNRFVLGNVLEANETQLALMLEFFPDGDASQEPAVSKASDKTWILNEVGFCLMSLGRLDEAITFYERKTPIDLGLEDWSNASVGYRNLAVLHIRLGVLATAAEAAREALALAHRAENKEDERNSLAWQAWIAHLRGDMATAGADFQQAEALEQEINSNERYLYSGRGIWHADHLRRAGDADYARRVTDANVKSCEEYHWPQFLSQSHRVLGDLDADAGQHDSARSHYDEALKLARSISRRDVLIEALLARGLWYAKYQQDAPAAFSDLNEVFGYATEGGFRIHEADIRVALAWAHLDAGDRGLARNEATRAQAMSAEMGYHWGQVDAAEVLAKIEDSSAQ